MDAKAIQGRVFANLDKYVSDKIVITSILRNFFQKVQTSHHTNWWGHHTCRNVFASFWTVPTELGPCKLFYRCLNKMQLLSQKNSNWAGFACIRRQQEVVGMGWYEKIPAQQYLQSTMAIHISNMFSSSYVSSVENSLIIILQQCCMDQFLTEGTWNNLVTDKWQ